ncbi:S8 family peptidase [Nocardioides bigeumensis]|uniref:Serine protease n=1 Tax=Nocardioides bigeumensis TaxID=433657 RepID=A0ABN2XU54_9ACTN
MKRSIALVSLALTAGVLSAPSAIASGVAPGDGDRTAFVAVAARPAMAGGVIVHTRGSEARRLGGRAVVRGVAADLAHRVGGRVRSQAVLPGVTALRTGLISAADAQALADELAERADVAWAEPDLLMHTDELPDPPDQGADALPPVAANDPLFGSLYNVWDNRDATSPEVAAKAPSAWPAGGYGTKAPALWTATKGAPSVVVAVLDTGVRPHPDLAPQLVAGYDMVADLTTANDGDGRDADPTDPGDWVTAGLCGPGAPAENSSWHGTHVSGTVAAAADNLLGVAGVAPGVKIQPVRVLGRCGGFSSDIAAGIAWASGAAVPGLPANATPARVVNMSLGGVGVCSSTYQSAIDVARSRGTTIVVSAGNDNASASDKSPASCAGVVTVGATSEYGDKAAYSNFGPVVDVSAPGGDSTWDGRGVLSTYNAGLTTPAADSYAELEGTSMAAPAVSGAAALLASLGGFTPDQAETALKSAVIAFPTSAVANWAQCSVGVCGSGVVDLGQVPAPLSGPTIAGSPTAGARVSAAPGTWTGPVVPLAYTWLLDGRVVGSGPTFLVDRPGNLVLRSSPATGAFTPVTSDSAAAATIGKLSKTRLAAPKRVRAGVRFKVTLKVKVNGTKKPKGKVVVLDGSKVVGKAKLVKRDKGRLVVRLKKPLKKTGKHKLTARFTGKPGVFGSTSAPEKVKVVRA